jgi:hypothetical protein
VCPHRRPRLRAQAGSDPVRAENPVGAVAERLTAESCTARGTADGRIPVPAENSIRILAVLGFGSTREEALDEDEERLRSWEQPLDDGPRLA